MEEEKKIKATLIFKIPEKDYTQYAILWGVFTWLVGWVGKDATEVGDYVRTWGLDSPQAEYVAKEESVETYNYEYSSN